MSKKEFAETVRIKIDELNKALDIAISNGLQVQVEIEHTDYKLIRIDIERITAEEEY